MTKTQAKIETLSCGSADQSANQWTTKTSQDSRCHRGFSVQISLGYLVAHQQTDGPSTHRLAAMEQGRASNIRAQSSHIPRPTCGRLCREATAPDELCAELTANTQYRAETFPLVVGNVGNVDALLKELEHFSIVSKAKDLISKVQRTVVLASARILKHH